MYLIFKIAKKDPRFGDHRNPDAISRGVWYIWHGQKHLPEQERFIGSEGMPEGLTPDEVIRWMMRTKRAYDMMDGVQCKHLIVSFGEKPPWKRKKLRKVLQKIVGFWKNRYEIYWGIHSEMTENGPNWHLHILLNTVDLKTGNRLNLSKKLWRKFKEETTKTWERALQSEKESVARR